MILHCEFEELQALDRGAALVLDAHSGRSSFLVPASEELLSQVENLQPLLVGSIEVHDLAEIDGIQAAVHLIARTLLQTMQARILELHPAHEEAVGMYFDYAHVLGVENRVNHMAAEMHALAELISPGPMVG
jgi:hypothetical protein